MRFDITELSQEGPRVRDYTRRGEEAWGMTEEGGDPLGREVVPARARTPLPLNPRSRDAPGEVVGS